jgi:protein-S-isoprenylcysteine O-methyltransferase Ste14
MACSMPGQTRKRLMPPTYFLIFLILVVASRFLLPTWVYATPLTLIAGIALMDEGIALNLLSDSAFKRRNTPVSPGATPSSLVVSGVFRLTRNPMYLGMASIVAAAALLVGEPAGLIFAGVLILLMDRLFVPFEERNLQAAFGEDYAAYKSSVRRWV